MADETPDSRTEAPTPRRREEARQQGRVAFSSELASALLLLAAGLALTFVARTMGTGLLETVQQGLLHSHVTDPSPQQVQGMFLAMLGRGLELIGLLLGVLFVLGVAAGTVQVGWYLAPGLLAFNWARLSPTAGASRLMSLAGLLR